MSDSARVSSQRTHLAIVHRNYLRKILDGSKTIESRFSKVRCPPHGVIAPGDQILLKPPGGAVIARARAASVLFFGNLDEEKIGQIAQQYGSGMQVDEDFLKDHRDARYCTLVFLEDVTPIEPTRVPKRDRRGWVVLPSSTYQATRISGSAQSSTSVGRSANMTPIGDRDQVSRVTGKVAAVSRSAKHTLSKGNDPAIQLIAGLGVEGDAHAGTLVKHRSRVARDPSQPNLRQVHLIHAELHAELRRAGFEVVAGQMGENITTEGIDLLGLPTGTRLHLGEAAIVEITGLRNPCTQLDRIQPGLMEAVLDRDAQGKLVRKAGIMGVVIAGGLVQPGDAIVAELPAPPHHPLEPV